MSLVAFVSVWLALLALFVDAPGEDHLLTTGLLLAIALTAAIVDRLTERRDQ